MQNKIGIIGFGNMGSAIAERIMSNYSIWVFDKDKNKTRGLTKINIAEDIIDLLNKVDILILAVKPQDFDGVLNEIKPSAQNKLIISIAAGFTTAYIEKILGEVKVIRAMPNMPARVGEGTICLSKGKFASLDDFDFSKNLFAYLGQILRIEERMMNAATAISGSGPGFCYGLIQTKNIDTNNIDEIEKFVQEVFVPAFTQAAGSIGFSQEEARFLAVNTGRGCIGLLKKTKFKPFELIEQIASKGGTTEAGLEVLHRGGSLEEAVKAALRRAEELSKGGIE